MRGRVVRAIRNLLTVVVSSTIAILLGLFLLQVYLESSGGPVRIPTYC